MRNSRILLPVAAVLMMTGCYDQKMEWKTPEGHYPATSSDIPLSEDEIMANYEDIKVYAEKYMPGVTIGAGIGADLYMNDAAYCRIVNDNFQSVTTGNAMKNSSVLTNSGSPDFTTIDAFLERLPADMKLYGHNFVWHTQQKQAYYKSIIAPEIIVEPGEDDVCENIITNSSFDENYDGWSSWSHHTKEITSPGKEGAGALKLTVDSGSSNQWDDQLFWTMSEVLTPGVTYAYQYWAKTDTPGIKFQFIGQSSNYAQQHYAENNELTSTWVQYTGEFTLDEAKDAIIRVGGQFGGTAGTLYIDEFKFGKKVEKKPSDPMVDIIGDKGTFEDGTTTGWGSWGNGSSKSVSGEGEGYESKYAMVLVNPTDADMWSAQCAYDMSDHLNEGTTYIVQFRAKCTTGAGQVQFQVQNSSTYGSQEGYKTFDLTGEWTLCQQEFTSTHSDANRLLVNFGAVAGTYYIDDFKFGEKIPESNAQAAEPTGTKITYKIKTPEEKKAILLEAQTEWIKCMSEHIGDRAYAWDVINEPISDDCQIRGIEGGWMEGDAEPVEDPVTGAITLNWDTDHWYWGYWCGIDYAVNAFQKAREYNPSARLYVNDYGLESNPAKLAKLIEFIGTIEAAGASVDGIGTQMHVYAASSSLADTTSFKEKFDAMFKTLAATGKYIRVTEFDVQVGTDKLTDAKSQLQAIIYRMAVESFKENVPAARQDGITIWGISDNKAEHEYWLNGDHPNLWDESYQRKPAYRYFCDGVAGFDLSSEMDGSQWEKAYEE